MSLLTPGMKGEAVTTVTPLNTAIAYGSGGVSVFATPAMIGLMEKAALSSVASCLEAGMTTVGIRVDIKHISATPMGMSVRAVSELVEVDGRRLVFKVDAWDDHELVGTGIHERVIVTEKKFLERASGKKK